MTHALAITPTVELYIRRANEAYYLRDLASALADAESARALDPSSVDAVEQVSRLKAERGDVAGAIALLDDRIARGGEMHNIYRNIKAGILGDYGDPSEALALFDSLIAEKPGSPFLLNARCWTKATRQVMLDTALKDCTQAIELSSNTTASLDSRAMVWYRLGRYTEALTDLDAVLGQSPAQAESRFMRSVVLKRLHRDAEAATELALARRMAPTVDLQYARYGITPS